MLKKVIAVATSHSQNAKFDKAFWAKQTPQARLNHALELRKVNYGTDRVSSRLQRVLEITQRPSR
ncbi:MAG: hypothetical protein ACKOQT_05145 [Acidimicrobiaceae bacterium]